MDRQIDKVDEANKNHSTSKTAQEDSSCPPATTSVAVPKEEIKKEEESSIASSSSSCNTKTTVGGDSNVGNAAAVNNNDLQDEKPPVVSLGESDTTCGISTTTTTLQLTTITRKDDDKKIQNKVEMSTSITNTTTAMNDQSITTTCSEDDNISSISVSSTTYDTTSSSKTVNNGAFDSCTEKVLDESDKNNVNNKSEISSSLLCSLQPDQQQMKGKDISNDGEIKNNDLTVGSNRESSVSSPTIATISNNNNNNTDVKMTSIVADVEKRVDKKSKADSQQHGPVPVQDSQVGCNVPEVKNPYSSGCCTVGEEIENEPDTATSSSIVANKDAGGRKEDTQPGETTCPEQPPKRIVSSSDCIHLSEDEGNVICSNNNNDDNQQVTVTGDDGSLNQVASQKNTVSSPVKPAASVSASAAVNPLNPVHKTNSPNQNSDDVKTLPNEPSGKIDITPESTLQPTPAPPSPESKLDKFSSDLTDIMKPSTNSSLENAGSRLPSVNSGFPQTNTSITMSSSPLKQPLEKVDDLSRVTTVSTTPTQTLQSSTDDSSKRFPSKDLAGASKTVEPKSANKSCVQGQEDIADLTMLSKGHSELTNLSSARSEVPKKSEQDAVVRTAATLSLGDTVRDTDEHSSKRSDSDSQDVTPSDSLSIPSDRDLECVDIASLGAADNDTGAASLKVTKDGASSSSSSSVLSIYHLKWIHFKSKKVPVITQNENGPCPLLAIMNVLLLQGRVTLESGLELITSEQLMDHLDECILENVPKTASEDVQLNYQQNMQDGMAVIHKLQTGLDVNVRFTGVQHFEYTTECIIFDLLGISLYHGWLVDPQSHDIVSAIGMCSYNQLVEKIIVQKTSEDIKLFTEATIAENFLEKTASQLTYHGLCELSTTVKEGELCVFFRNNHFSTLYRHKNELFLLVTDQGFLNECNVVWETLSSVEGDCYFVDAEFNTYTKPDPVSGNSVVTPPVVPIGSDQQIDQDYLVALSLEREQQLQREAWASHAGGAGIGGVGMGSGAAVPDPLRGHHVQLSDLELAKKLQDEENQRAGAAAAATNAASNRRNQRAADACTSTGARRTRDRERDKDGCFIL